jgi:hypothetical protein
MEPEIWVSGVNFFFFFFFFFFFLNEKKTNVNVAYNFVIYP